MPDKLHGPLNALKESMITHTFNHRNCPACMTEGLRDMQQVDFQRLLLKEAGEIWLQTKRLYVTEDSVKDYRKCLDKLYNILGDLPLNEIHIGNLRFYQAEQRKHYGPVRINRELWCLKSILTEADLWKNIADRYQALPMPKPQVGGALTPEQEDNLLRVAKTRPRWRVAWLMSQLQVNTTLGTGEARKLRICDVDLKRRKVYVRGHAAKNDYRVREIWLNDSALQAAVQLLDRYQQLLKKWDIESEPTHFLLPHRADSESKPPDPTRPQTSWNTAWRALRKAAGLPKNFRPYDLRHHSITKVMENPMASESVAIEITGHKDAKMIRKVYGHLRQDAITKVLGAIDSSSVMDAPKPTIEQTDDLKAVDRLLIVLAERLRGLQ